MRSSSCHASLGITSTAPCSLPTRLLSIIIARDINDHRSSLCICRQTVHTGLGATTSLRREEGSTQSRGPKTHVLTAVLAPRRLLPPV